MLLLSHRSFPLTRLLYVVIAIHALILILGGTYTYAGYRRGSGCRNGSTSAATPTTSSGILSGRDAGPARRGNPVAPALRRAGEDAGLFAVCVALAFSAFYELIEWWVALLADTGRRGLLGTRAIPDTQSDMLMALLGALLSVSLLAGRQDRQIEHLQRAGAAD